MRGHYKIVFLVFSTVVFLLSLPSIPHVFAQSSGCSLIKVGTPPSNEPLPSGCASGGGSWPFPTKDPSQYKRIDEGWDLQYNQATDIHAIAPGVISQARPNPEGFGPDYPLEALDAPILGYKMLYYGHVHIEPSVVGKHVNTGDIIAHSDPTGATAGGLANWLEVGFWDAAIGPAAKPHYAGGESSTPEGEQMKQWLLQQNP